MCGNKILKRIFTSEHIFAILYLGKFTTIEGSSAVSPPLTAWREGNDYAPATQ